MKKLAELRATNDRLLREHAEATRASRRVQQGQQHAAQSASSRAATDFFSGARVASVGAASVSSAPPGAGAAAGRRPFATHQRNSADGAGRFDEHRKRRQQLEKLYAAQDENVPTTRSPRPTRDDSDVTPARHIGRDTGSMLFDDANIFQSGSGGVTDSVPTQAGRQQQQQQLSIPSPHHFEITRTRHSMLNRNVLADLRGGTEPVVESGPRSTGSGILQRGVCQQQQQRSFDIGGPVAFPHLHSTSSPSLVASQGTYCQPLNATVPPIVPVATKVAHRQEPSNFLQPSAFELEARHQLELERLIEQQRRERAEFLKLSAKASPTPTSAVAQHSSAPSPTARSAAGGTRRGFDALAAGMSSYLLSGATQWVPAASPDRLSSGRVAESPAKSVQSPESRGARRRQQPSTVAIEDSAASPAVSVTSLAARTTRSEDVGDLLRWAQGLDADDDALDTFWAESPGQRRQPAPPQRHAFDGEGGDSRPTTSNRGDRQGTNRGSHAASSPASGL